MSTHWWGMSTQMDSPTHAACGYAEAAHTEPCRQHGVWSPQLRDGVVVCSTCQEGWSQHTMDGRCVKVAHQTCLPAGDDAEYKRCPTEAEARELYGA